MNANKPDKTPPEPESLTLWQTLQSVSASMFGVQSRKNRERDFTRGKALHFIIIGLIMVGAFIAVLAVIVKLLLRNAGM
jgi:uncharacterized BrkB/YihY/UPF0761 family membrane protein